MCLDIFLHQGKVYDVISSLPILLKGNAWQTNLDVCSLYFSSVFIGCVDSREQNFWCEFFNREMAGHHGSVLWFCFPSWSTAPTTTKTISCVCSLSYFRGLFLSGPSLLSILLATEWHATEIPNLVPHATAWQSAVPFFLCSISLAWDWFYSFLYSPSRVPWFIVIGIFRR